MIIWIKKNPFLTALIVLGLIIGIYFLFFSGKSSEKAETAEKPKTEQPADTTKQQQPPNVATPPNITVTPQPPATTKPQPPVPPTATVDSTSEKRMKALEEGQKAILEALAKMTPAPPTATVPAQPGAGGFQQPARQHFTSANCTSVEVIQVTVVPSAPPPNCTVYQTPDQKYHGRPSYKSKLPANSAFEDHGWTR